MPFSGGTYGAPSSSWNPAVAATTIDATDWAALLSDLSTALSTAMLKDGSQTVTANIPMASHKFTGLSAGTVAGDSVRYEQVIGAFLPITGGTLTGNLLFTDATYDIGAAGATRPRDFYLSRNAVIGGTLAVTGHPTLEGVTATGATGTNLLVFATSPTLGTPTLTSPVLNTGVSGTALANQAAMDAGTSTSLLETPSLNKISILATQATTSGTSKDFTIPSGAREIVVSIVGVSTNGTSNYLVQIGSGGTPVTTGYLSGSAIPGVGSAQSTAGFICTQSTGASDAQHGQIILRLVDPATFQWTASGILYATGSNAMSFSSGRGAGTAEVTTVRVTTVSADTFDAGLVGCSYIR